MCSIGNDDNYGDSEKYMLGKEKISLLQNACNKCKINKPCIILRGKDCYCRNCFIIGTVHKFKSLLGKHKLIRPNDLVLVVYETGHPTTALLHFLRNGLDLNTPKKLRFLPIIVFIENNYHLNVDERRDLLEQIEKQVNLFKFELYFISLLDFLVLNSNHLDTILVKELKDIKLSNNDQEEFKKLLNKQKNETNKLDYLQIIRRELLINVAKYLQCKFIFTTELSNNVASQLLTNISLGRGSHVPIDTGFCDNRNEQIQILRPLRLFNRKELAFYNYFNNLDCIVSFKQFEKKLSIQNLMEKFVDNLQINYPSTINTILKTGDKLAIDQNSSINNNNVKTCVLCKAPFNYENNNLTSAESTKFSHWVSTQIPNHTITPQERYNKTLESFENLNSIDYCFACQKLN